MAVHFAKQGNGEVSLEGTVVEDEMVTVRAIPSLSFKNPLQVHENLLPSFCASPGNEFKAASLKHQNRADTTKEQVARIQSQLYSLQGKFGM